MKFKTGTSHTNNSGRAQGLARIAKRLQPALMLMALAWLAIQPVQADPISLGVFEEFAFTTAGTPATGCDPADPAGPFCISSSGTPTDFIGAPPWTFTAPAGGVELTVVDAFTSGDRFTVFDLGASLGLTSAPPSNVDCGDDPVVCLASGLSQGHFSLAAGNCVVIKPSEHASVTTLEFCRFVEAAGFPQGVVNVVCGAADVGRALVDGGVAKVSFTGSAAVGREIAAAAGRRLIPVTLELGGKSPNIIFEDANLERAAVGALAGIFGATGQTCVAGSRLLVQRSVHDRILQTLVERARAVRLGDPLDPATDMGTAANEPQFRRILGFIERARAEGARVVAGGGAARGPGLEHGFFVEPTVFAEVHNEMEIAQQEVFGPVLAVIPFEDEEEGIRIANATPYGLAAGVWTENLSRAMRVSRALDRLRTQLGSRGVTCSAWTIWSISGTASCSYLRP